MLLELINCPFLTSRKGLPNKAKVTASRNVDLPAPFLPVTKVFWTLSSWIVIGCWPTDIIFLYVTFFNLNVFMYCSHELFVQHILAFLRKKQTRRQVPWPMKHLQNIQK
ncbi:hypothetical protein CJ20_299 [Escherichia phage CJ20]|nr:hypothetical protein CJ20_299 [Escherichia phage CJ20]